MSDWVVGMLIKERRRWFAASPYCVGFIEFTRIPPIEEEMLRAFRTSAAANAVELRADSLWAKIVVRETDIDGAWSWARTAITEALDALPLCGFGSLDGEALPVGFCFNIQSADSKAQLPTRESHYPFGLFAEMDNLAVHPLFTIRHIIGVGSDRRSQIAQALLRSVHWSRLARDAGPIDKFLFLWMALESLTKTKEAESITPKVAAALGFLKDARYFDLPERLLFKDSSIRAWRRVVVKLLDECRNLRNDIVHRGFRELDALHAGMSIGQKIQLLKLAAPRVQQVAVNGAKLGFTSLDELWTTGFASAFRFGRHGSIVRETLEVIIPDLKKTAASI